MSTAAHVVTPKERRFLVEYIANDRNATRAYMKVFKNKSYASSAELASRLLKIVEIQAELKAIQEEQARQLRISPARVLKELALIAFSDIGEAFTPAAGGGPDDVKPLSRMRATTRRAIQSAKVKKRRLRGKGDMVEEVEEVEYKLYSKQAALEALCKKLGLFKDDDKPADAPPVSEAERLEMVARILASAMGRADDPKGETP